MGPLWVCVCKGFNTRRQVRMEVAFISLGMWYSSLYLEWEEFEALSRFP